MRGCILCIPRCVESRIAGSRRGLAGRLPPPDSDPLSKVEFRKNSPASQGKGDNTQIYGRSHDGVIRVYDEAGNVIETHEHKDDFKEW